MHPYSRGTEIASYRVESLIGRGGMAFVYRAKDLRLDRWVALKVLTPALVQTAQFRERFLRESRLAASLDHPNIIPIYEAGEAEDLLYIAMRYVEGGDLHALVEREGPLTLASATVILSQVAEALDAAHARGLVHRDVKPQNILIASAVGTTRPHVYLSDFGLTKRTASGSKVTTFGQFIGTMNYAAPEQIAYRSVDGRTDLYALGCVAYQCLTGTVPFVRDDEAALLWAHLVEMPPPASSHRGELAAVDAVLAKAMAKDPDGRYDTCGQFAADLARLVDGPVPSTPEGSEEWRESAREAAAEKEPVSALPQPDALTIIVDSQSGSPVRPHVAEGLGPERFGQGSGSGDGEDRGSIPATRHRRQQPRKRRGTQALVAVGTITLVLLGVVVARAFTSGTKTVPPRISAASTSGPSGLQDCTAAVGAADQSLDHAGRVEAALGEHAAIMDRLDKGQLMPQQAFDLGMPSLRRGASESPQFDQAFRNYQQAATKCRSVNASGLQDCTAAVGAADQSLDHAGRVEAALQEHTAIMDRLEYGQLTPQQAFDLGMPSLRRGASESAQFDQAFRNYQQAAAKCR